MNQESINHKLLAVCFFGDKSYNYNIDEAQFIIYNNLSKIYNIVFFHSKNYDDTFFNLYYSSFLKRSFEITRSMYFDVCLAINVNNLKNLDFNLINNTLPCDKNTCYFYQGGFYIKNFSTFIKPDFFYSDSLTFDFISKFGQVYNCLPKARKSQSLEEDFYYFLKSLKIKTKTINYNNFVSL